jgi:hypothetical protein
MDPDVSRTRGPDGRRSLLGHAEDGEESLLRDVHSADPLHPLLAFFLDERLAVLCGTMSLPFEPGAHRRAAIKIADDRGIESLKILEVNEDEASCWGMSLPIPVPEADLVALSRRHRIRPPALFGSVLREDFSPASDADVLGRA